MGGYPGLNSPREPIRIRKASPGHRSNAKPHKAKGCAVTAIAMLATGGAGVIYGVVQGIRAVIS